MTTTKEEEAMNGGPHNDDDDDDDYDDEVDQRRTQCGVGSYRPKGLQTFANLKSFTAVLSALQIFGNINYSYYTAVITQIERNFGLTSSMTGFIKNVDNIGYMTTVLLVSHFCRYSNKPLLFSAATVMTSIAIFIFALPHFLYGAGEEDPLMTDLNGTTLSANLSKYEFCDAVNENGNGTTTSSCNSRNMLRAFNSGALALFVVSELLQGIAQSPKHTLSVTYMDDNAKSESPRHYGVMFGMRSFSPIIGFMLAAWTTSIYVDLSDPGYGQRDPRWVGAWWIGFIICAAISVVWALPLLFFPREMKTNTSRRQQRRASHTGAKQDIKDLPKAFLRLLKNPVIVFVTCGGCFNMFLIGYGTFVPKYMELQFGVTPSMASIITGCVSVASWCLGPIISGCIVSRLKLSLRQLLQVAVVCNLVASLAFIAMFFLSCPEAEWAGTLNLNKQDVSMGCNSNCSCDPDLYTPVCGSDGVNYFSSCFAGCKAKLHNDTVFTDCQCIDGGSGTATLGVCPYQCNMIIAFIIVKILSMFIISLSFVPIMTVILRCVDDKDKALAMAFMGTLTQICSFPAPMLFGVVIDSTCIVSQSACGRKGACLLYDQHTFRYRMHYFAVGVKVIALFCYLLACYCTKYIKNTGYEKEVVAAENDKQSSKEMMALKQEDE